MLSINNMITILTLDEAVDLSNRGCNLDYQTVKELLANERNLRENVYVKERYYDSIVGNRVYAIRRIEDRFQYKHAGCLWNSPMNPRLGKFLVDYNELEKETKKDRNSLRKIKGIQKLLDMHLRLNEGEFPLQGTYGIKETILENNCITPEGSLQLVFDGKNEEFQRHLEERRCYLKQNDISGSIDYKGYSLVPPVCKNWYLALLGMHPNKTHCVDFCFPNPEFLVVWNGYLGAEFVGNLAQPKDIGNGVIVMSKDRIPKYFHRVWGLDLER